MNAARVLQLITHLDAGGAQETVILLAAGLANHGFDVTVAAGPGGTERPRLTGRGIRVDTVATLRRDVSPPADVRALFEIAALVRAGGFDVVHTHSSKAGVLGRLAARRCGVRAIVHTSHGLPVNPDMSGPERAVLTAAERVAARACDRVVAVSRATAAELVSLRLARPGRIVVIPSGVELPPPTTAEQRAAARAALGLPPDCVAAGWIGRYFAQKRPDLVVAAARRIVDSVERAHVVLAGDGPLLEQARATAAGHPRIHFAGYVRDIAAVYAAIDVMLLASAWEGLPRTVLEALGAGVPVVSTDVSGVSEVVSDGINGALAPPGRWEELAEAAISILTDDTARAEMAAAARAGVGRTYSAAHTVAATAALYDELLSARPRPA